MGECTDFGGGRIRLAVVWLAAAFLLPAGCAPAHTALTAAPATQASATVEMPASRPGRVLVAVFAADPDAVKLPLEELTEPEMQEAQGALRRNVATTVQEAVADTLVLRLRGMGLPARRAAAHLAGKGDLVILGRILAVDGAGNAEGEVRARVDLVYISPTDGKPRLLQSYRASSATSMPPGTALGDTQEALGLAAAAPDGRHRRSGPAGQGDRLADVLTVEIGTFCAGQGWVPASVVPSQSTL